MNEDFVPFEIARKLKEKGFKEKCYAYYFPVNNELCYNINQFRGGNLYDCLYSYNSLPKELVASDFIDAPTISQVLKWLREEKIHISPCCYKDDEPRFAGWYYLIIDMRNKIWKYYNQDYRRDNTPATYESAAIDAIEFCLDELI